MFSKYTDKVGCTVLWTHLFIQHLLCHVIYYVYVCVCVVRVGGNMISTIKIKDLRGARL